MASDPAPEEPRHTRQSGGALSEKFRQLSGLMLGGGIIYAAFFGAYYYWADITKRTMETTGELLTASIGAILIVTLFYVGGRIVVNSIRRQVDVIPPADRSLLEPLIASSDEKAIEQYIRLSSLTGVTGTATRLGLTGLPLLTVALTLIFCGVELYRPDTGFMDLAKLTLGAFIGSFVQRSATTQAIASSGGKPPTSGELSL